MQAFNCWGEITRFQILRDWAMGSHGRRNCWS